MKNLDMLRLLNEIDDDLIEKANPLGLSYKKKKLAFRHILLVACICCVLTVGLAILIPFLNKGKDNPDISNTSNSIFLPNDVVPPTDYVPTTTGKKMSYEIIKGIIENSGNNSSDNTLDDLFPITGDTLEKGYVQIEGNRINGIEEGSLVKEKDGKIYFLEEGKVNIYSEDKENSCLLGSYSFASGDSVPKGIYVSPDGKTSTVFYEENGYGYVTLLNVENVEDITEINEISYKGGYVLSTYRNGEFILFSRFNVINTESIENYIPSFDLGNGYEVLPIESLVSPDEIHESSYFVITKIEEKGLNYKGSVALLDFDNTLYLSNDNIYVTRDFVTVFKNNYTEMSYLSTEIARIEYGKDMLDFKNTVALEGTVNDKTNMDEYNGTLRVFTTVETIVNEENSETGEIIEYSNVSANFYCVEISNMIIDGKVENFAPLGERVYSVRFDKDKAYVCTLGGFLDPVFVFDVSNPEKILHENKETVEGYLNYLVELGGDYLLGIKNTSGDSIEIMLFLRTEETISCVSQYTIEKIKTLDNQFFLDTEKGIFALSYQNEKEIPWKYAIFKIKDGEMNLIQTVEFAEISSLNKIQGVYSDGYYYIIAKDVFEKIQIN